MIQRQINAGLEMVNELRRKKDYASLRNVVNNLYNFIYARYEEADKSDNKYVNYLKSKLNYVFNVFLGIETQSLKKNGGVSVDRAALEKKLFSCNFRRSASNKKP